MELSKKITDLLKNGGAYDVGFAKVDDAPAGLDYAVSIVVPLSDAIIDEIDQAPTHTYFHHYRTVNALIDRLLLMTGLMLQREGYRYITIAASQSVDNEVRGHSGRYSHKKAAVLAGLGTVGKNSLFLHPDLGPRLRLGTLFTDCPLTAETHCAESLCGDCELCVKACPAHAISGAQWEMGLERSVMFDPEACNAYMRGHFMKIGRGSVCGICVRVCRFGRKKAGAAACLSQEPPPRE